MKELVFIFVSYVFYLNKTNYLFSIFFAIMFIRLGFRLLNILINLNKNSNKIMYSNPNLNKVKNNKSFFSNNVCTFKDVVVINKMFKRSMLNGVNNIVIKRTSDIIKYKTLKSDIIYNSSTNNKIIGPNYNNLIIPKLNSGNYAFHTLLERNSYVVNNDIVTCEADDVIKTLNFYKQIKIKKDESYAL